MWRAIIVDDEAFVREDMIVQFSWDEYHFELVGQAENGKTALSLIGTQHPDLVFTDIRMPEMDGLALIAWIREHEPQIITVVISAFNDFPYVREALRLGAFDYIMKAEIGLDTTCNLLDKLERKLGQQKAEPDKNRTAIHCSDLLKKDTYSPNSMIIKKALAFIQSNYTRDLTLQEVAEHVGASKCFLSRIFPEYAGEHFSEYLLGLRLDKAKELLRFTDLRIYEVGNKVGFWNVRYFSRVFRKIEGTTPADYRWKFFKDVSEKKTDPKSEISTVKGSKEF